MRVKGQGESTPRPGTQQVFHTHVWQKHHSLSAGLDPLENWSAPPRWGLESISVPLIAPGGVLSASQGWLKGL